MGKVDIQEVKNMMRYTKLFIRSIWSSDISVRDFMLLIIVLFQYMESWTAKKMKNNYDRYYFVHGDHISEKVGEGWSTFASNIRNARELLCHNFGSESCRNVVRMLYKDLNRLYQFMEYIGVFSDIEESETENF